MTTMGRFLTSLLGRKPIEVSAQTVGSSRDHSVRLVLPASGAGTRGASLDPASLRETIEQGLILQHAGRIVAAETHPEGLVIDMEGPNADRIASAALNSLRTMRMPSGAHLLKRYGGPGAREKRIDL
jgi:hypothetical protein